MDWGTAGKEVCCVCVVRVLRCVDAVGVDRVNDGLFAWKTSKRMGIPELPVHIMCRLKES